MASTSAPERFSDAISPPRENCGGPPTSWLARRFGSTTSGLAYEIQGADGEVAMMAMVATDRGYRSAVAPAVLATERLVRNTAMAAGIVLPHQQLAAGSLPTYLAGMNLQMGKIAAPADG